MKVINVFIAGSIELKEERQAIFASANGLNAEFKNDKQVIFYTYNGVGNNMSAFKDFIRNKADIVLFLIKDKIGEYTEEEYKSAISDYHKNGLPYTFVLLHSYGKKTSDIEYIENLMKDSGDENFYTTYSNTHDLVDKVKKNHRSIPSYTTTTNNEMGIWGGAICIVLCTSIILHSFKRQWI